MWHKFRVVSWQPEILSFLTKVSVHYDVMICWSSHTCLSFRGMKRPAFLQQSGCRQNGRPPEKMWHVVLKFALYLSRGTPLSATLWDFHRVVYLPKINDVPLSDKHLIPPCTIKDHDIYQIILRSCKAFPWRCMYIIMGAINETVMLLLRLEGF